MMARELVLIWEQLPSIKGMEPTQYSELFSLTTVREEL